MTPPTPEQMRELARLIRVGEFPSRTEMAEKVEAAADALELRDNRQRKIAGWAAECFGAEHASSVPQRALRLLEEAVEASQAAGCDEAMAHKLVSFVFSRPADPLARELGGIGVCLLCLAEAAGLSAEAEEEREIERVMSKPREHFTARNQAKNDAGFLATPSQGRE